MAISRRMRGLATILLTVLVGTAAGAGDEQREALWAAVRSGDAKAVATRLDQGADVNARNQIGAVCFSSAANTF